MEADAEDDRVDKKAEALFAETHEPAVKRAKESHTWHRGKCERILVDLDSALQGPQNKGPGLSRFQLQEKWWEDCSEALLWPTLVLSTDQDPNIW